MKPAGHARVARVVDHDGLEVRFAVREDGQQPPLEVGDPAVRDGYERHGARRCGLILSRRRLQRLELAPRGAVQDVPPTGAQLFTDRIARFEVAIAPALDAFSQKLFGL